jgi:predicted HicB family RNase H-like nuclease
MAKKDSKSEEVTIHVRVPETVRQKLWFIAGQEDRSLASVVRIALQQYLANQA